MELEEARAKAEEARRAAERECRVVDAEAEELKKMARARESMEEAAAKKEEEFREELVRIQASEAAMREEEETRARKIQELEREKKEAADFLRASQAAAEARQASAREAHLAHLREEKEKREEYEKQTVDRLVQERLEIEAQLTAIKEAERAQAAEKIRGEQDEIRRKVLDEQKMRMQETQRQCEFLNRQRQEIDFLAKEADNTLMSIAQDERFPQYERMRMIESNKHANSDLLRKRDHIEELVRQAEDDAQREAEALKRMQDDYIRSQLQKNERARPPPSPPARHQRPLSGTDYGHLSAPNSPYRNSRPPLPRPSTPQSDPRARRALHRSHSAHSSSNSVGSDWDNQSHASMVSTASSVKSVADEALHAILEQMESAKVQLAQETNVENQLRLANLLEKLASAASSMKKLESAYA